MNSLAGFVAELRERKVLPIIALLLVAIIAVPVALSKPAKAPSSPPVPSSPVASRAATLPAVTVRSTLRPVRLDSRPRDPFNQGPKAKARSSSATSGSSTAKASSASTSSSSSPGQANGTSGTHSTPSGGGSSSSTSSSTTTTTTTTSTHAVAPSGLGAEEAYSVTIGLTQGSGLNTLDGVRRLTPLPSSAAPALLPLGVLQGGDRVLFAALPGAVLTGPGRCVPGVVDCEVLVLSPGQIERVRQGSTSLDFAVTGIHITRYSSIAATQRARRAVSSRGEALLRQADLAAVSLFPFDTTLGALVDLRNLKSGAS